MTRKKNRGNAHESPSSILRRRREEEEARRKNKGKYLCSFYLDIFDEYQGNAAISKERRLVLKPSVFVLARIDHRRVFFLLSRASLRRRPTIKFSL